HDAESFTLLLPRAQAPGAGGQGVFRPDQLRRAQEVPFRYPVEELPDRVVVRAALLAGGAGALQAALGFDDGFLDGVAEIDFGETLQALFQRQLVRRRLVPIDLAAHPVFPLAARRVWPLPSARGRGRQPLQDG